MPRLTLQTQAILAVLLRSITTPLYGLEMAKAADLPSGTIYPILARLERSGWVESALEDIDPKVAGRRARRYYTLTAEGERIAQNELSITLNDLDAIPRSSRPLSQPAEPRATFKGVLPT
ncbi:MAG: PadR family transcriptional regulator [Solirubrobacteraceae bacterium]|jgi:DNA-binding PadR family transcriptional regulator